jgi:transcriptional regulator with XRE-family HTH domain
MSKKENPNAVYLGRAIACTRIEQGMKRKDLVEAAGISYPFLAELENGHKWPSFAMLDRIAEALGVGSLYLFSRAKCIGEDYPVLQNATGAVQS